MNRSLSVAADFPVYIVCVSGHMVYLLRAYRAVPSGMIDHKEEAFVVIAIASTVGRSITGPWGDLAGAGVIWGSERLGLRNFPGNS